MVKQIFVNLPVADLKASIAFFTRLGFTFNPQFTDETGTCMIVGENIFAMLLARERFAGFAPHPPADARAATEVLLALPLDSREAVDAMVREAVAAGGNTYSAPQDHGFMYQHGFQDLDGHVWEVFQMNPQKGD
ncbi:MAG: VOC family protein [Thiobacillus sp.]|nr:VOC family protein [Thiobacillus sp.]MDP3586038.1 VOC family protein [Thiobacillus sp.]